MRDDRALVIGAGPIGLSIAVHLLARAVRPVLADLRPDRRAFAASWSGVEVIDPGGDAEASVRHAMRGNLPTLVFDATGNAASMRSAFDLVAPGGRLVLVGLFQGDLAFHDPEFHRRELTLMASRNATGADFQRSIAILASGRARIGTWIMHRTTLDGLQTTFTALEGDGSGIVKAIVDV